MVQVLWLCVGIVAAAAFLLYARSLGPGQELKTLGIGLHFIGAGHGIAPEWYVYACLSFDLVVAAYIVYHASKNLRKSAQSAVLLS